MNPGLETRRPRTMRGIPQCVPIPIGESAPQRKSRMADVASAYQIQSDTDPEEEWRTVYAGTSEEAFLWQMARDCLEDVAVLRSHRILEPHETYLAASESEDRMLRQLDAILECGSEVLERLLTVDPAEFIVDPDHRFALALALACIDGDRSLRRLITLLVDVDGEDPDDIEAAIEALKLAPHPRLASALHAELNNGNPAVRKAAIEILSYRRDLAPESATRALRDPDPLVVATAARAFAELRSTDLPSSMVDLCIADDVEVALSACRTLIRHRKEAGWKGARRVCEQHPGSVESASELLGAAGCADDSARLRTLLRARPSAAIARALGLHGQISAIEDLIDVLDRDVAPDIKTAAAHALTLLSGADIDDEVEAALHEPEDEFFLESVPPPERQRIPSTKPELWQRWWSEHTAKLQTSQRIRRGQPLRPVTLLEEIASGHDRAQRRRAHFELSILAGDFAPHFDPLDFSAVQQASIDAWRDWIDAHGNQHRPGSWNG